MLATVAGAEARHRNLAAQLLIPVAFRDAGRFHRRDFHSGCGQQIVDMPVQFLRIGQMPPYPCRKIPPGAAGVYIVTCGKIAASQRTCHNPDILVQADVQLVGNVVFWIGKI